MLTVTDPFEKLPIREVQRFAWSEAIVIVRLAIPSGVVELMTGHRRPATPAVPAPSGKKRAPSAE
jgi:hypothetical protein